MLRLIAVAMAFVLLSCAAATAQTMERIAATKTVRIGYVADQAPFASTSNPPSGFAIDVCGKVVEAIAMKVENLAVTYVETKLADAFNAIASGDIDLLCGAITATLGRRELVDFSEPIFVDGMSALLRDDAPRDLRELFMGERTISPPRSPELRPFATSRVGVRAGSTTEIVLKKAIEQGGYSATVTVFEGHGDGLVSLEDDEIDAYFADRALLTELLQSAKDGEHLVLGSKLLTHELYCIAIARGDSELRLLVDRTLSEFYSTPDFLELLSKYFGDHASELRSEILRYAIPE